MIENFTEESMLVRTPSTEWAYVLMAAAQGLGGVVQKYYWASKFDNTVVEETEPMITDAYDCLVLIKGDIPTMNNIIDVYKQKREQRKGMPAFMTTISEKDIKEYAQKMLAIL